MERYLAKIIRKFWKIELNNRARQIPCGFTRLMQHRNVMCC